MSTDPLQVGSPTTSLWRLVIEVVAKAVTCMIAVAVGYIGSMFTSLVPMLLFPENYLLVASVMAITGWCWVIGFATFASWYLKRYRRLSFAFWAALGLALGGLPAGMTASLVVGSAIINEPVESTT